MATTGQTQTRVRDALALALGDIAQVRMLTPAQKGLPS